MKILQFLLLQIMACFIMTSLSIGQSTFNIRDGGIVTITSSISMQSHDLSIASSGQLAVRGNLTVSGVLANSAGTPGLVLKSDSEGYGSIMHTSASVPANIEQYLSSERWHLAAPAVSGETIEPYLDIYLKIWQENSGTWQYLTQPLSLGLNATSGYSVWASNDLTGTTTVNLEGTLNAGDITATNLIYTGTSPQPGWNLVGNPYPSSIDWDGNWATTNIGGWVLIYDNGTYKGWNPFLTGDDRSYNGKTDGLIAPGQGFWVRATGNDPELIFEQDSRTFGEVQFYKNDNSIGAYSGIRLVAEANDYTDETAIYFMEDGTLGFDGLYGLEKLYNVEESPTIYSVPASGTPTAINIMPENWIEEGSSPIIPVGFSIDQCTSCLVKIEGIESLDPELPIFLEDLKENECVDLRLTNGYSFSSSSSDDPNRFLIHFGNPSNINETLQSKVEIYSYLNKVYIRTPGHFKGKARIMDVNGKVISELDLSGGLNTASISHTGMYVIQVWGDDTAIQKVFIKN